MVPISEAKLPWHICRNPLEEPKASGRSWSFFSTQRYARRVRAVCASRQRKHRVFGPAHGCLGYLAKCFGVLRGKVCARRALDWRPSQTMY